MGGPGQGAKVLSTRLELTRVAGESTVPIGRKTLLMGPPSLGALDATGPWKCSQAGARSKPHFITRVARERTVSPGDQQHLLQEAHLSETAHLKPEVEKGHTTPTTCS